MNYAIDEVVTALFSSPDIYKAEKYLSPKLVVRATRRHKPSKRDRQTELVVTIGAPNYLERQFIKDCNHAGEKFPVRKIQLKFWPKRRASRTKK